MNESKAVNAAVSDENAAVNAAVPDENSEDVFVIW